MKIKYFTFISILFFIITPLLTFAQDELDTTKINQDISVKKDTLELIKVNLELSKPVEEVDSSENVGVKIIGYPYAFYSPETKLAIGLGGLLYFRTSTSPDIKPSKLQVAAYYTINNQYYFAARPSIYFPGKDELYFEGDFNFGEEIRQFYGVGNNTPDIENSEYKMKFWGFSAELAAEDLIIGNSRQGLIYEYSNNTIIDKLSNPNFADSGLTGLETKVVAGLGFSLSFDHRDNIFYSSSGYYLKLSGVFYGDPFGSAYSFDKYIIDFRNFWSPFDSHILAFQVYSNLTLGNPPFFKLPQIGGSYRMRGFLEGRYIDRQYFVTQFEYRKIIWWRLGVALFYSYGDVSDKIGNFRLKEFKHSWGAGLRFVFDEAEKINIRVDFGFAEGTTGVYFALDEAF